MWKFPWVSIYKEKRKTGLNNLPPSPHKNTLFWSALPKIPFLALKLLGKGWGTAWIYRERPKSKPDFWTLLSEISELCYLMKIDIFQPNEPNYMWIFIVTKGAFLPVHGQYRNGFRTILADSRVNPIFSVSNIDHQPELVVSIFVLLNFYGFKKLYWLGYAFSAAPSQPQSW